MRRHADSKNNGGGGSSSSVGKPTSSWWAASFREKAGGGGGAGVRVRKPRPCVSSSSSRPFSSRSAGNRFSIATTGRDLFACWTEDVVGSVRVAGGISHGTRPSSRLCRSAARRHNPRLRWHTVRANTRWSGSKIVWDRPAHPPDPSFHGHAHPDRPEPCSDLGRWRCRGPTRSIRRHRLVLVWNEGAPHARLVPSRRLAVGAARDRIAAFDRAAIARTRRQTAVLSHAAFVDRVTFTLLEPDRTNQKPVDLGHDGSGRCPSRHGTEPNTSRWRAIRRC